MNDLIHLQCSGSKFTPTIKKKKKKVQTIKSYERIKHENSLAPTNKIK